MTMNLFNRTGNNNHNDQYDDDPLMERDIDMGTGAAAQDGYEDDNHNNNSSTATTTTSATHCQSIVGGTFTIIAAAAFVTTLHQGNQGLFNQQQQQQQHVRGPPSMTTAVPNMGAAPTVHPINSKNEDDVIDLDKAVATSTPIKKTPAAASTASTAGNKLKAANDKPDTHWSHVYMWETATSLFVQTPEEQALSKKNAGTATPTTAALPAQQRMNAKSEFPSSNKETMSPKKQKVNSCKPVKKQQQCQPSNGDSTTKDRSHHYEWSAMPNNNNNNNNNPFEFLLAVEGLMDFFQVPFSFINDLSLSVVVGSFTVLVCAMLLVLWRMWTSCGEAKEEEKPFTPPPRQEESADKNLEAIHVALRANLTGNGYSNAAMTEEQLGWDPVNYEQLQRLDVIQLLNMLQAKQSGHKYNAGMNKLQLIGLLHEHYKTMLDKCKKEQLKAILQIKGVRFKATMKQKDLVELALHAGFTGTTSMN